MKHLRKSCEIIQHTEWCKYLQSWIEITKRHCTLPRPPLSLYVNSSFPLSLSHSLCLSLSLSVTLSLLFLTLFFSLTLTDILSLCLSLFLSFLHYTQHTHKNSLLQTLVLMFKRYNRNLSKEQRNQTQICTNAHDRNLFISFPSKTNVMQVINSLKINQINIKRWFNNFN